MMDVSKLPSTWDLIEIEESLLPYDNGKKIRQGWSPQCERFPAKTDGHWGVLKTSAIQDGAFIEEANKHLPEKLEPKEHLEVLSGDILMTCAGPRARCGVTCLVKSTRPKLLISGKMYQLRCDPSLMGNEFLEGYLREWNTKKLIDKMKTGISDSGLNLTHGRFKTLRIPLPPLNEQRRIVAKIEELFSEIDAGVASLKTARAQLGVYRQSLLKQAFEGKLTEKWRAQNPDQLEPAEQLLARIRSEREARYQKKLTDWQTAVEEWETNCKAGKKSGKPRKQTEVELLSKEELAKLSKLPSGLCWVKFGSLIDVPAYGTSKKCSYESEGRGVLRIPNLVKGIIDDGDLKFASFTEEEEENYQLIDGDLLLIRSNGSVSIVGRCVRVNQKHTKHLYAGYLIRMRPIHSVMDPDFIRMQLSSSALRNQIESFAKSTSGVNNINAKEIQALVLSVCSLPEQQEIVRILEEQFEAIEQNEAEIDAALQRAEALRQSILKKAFAGKLVPQDSDDEPASVLLERIRAEREAAEAAKKPTKKKVAKKRKATNHK